VGRSKIRSCALCQPANGANNTLVAALAFDEGGAVIGFVGFGTCVDREAQAVGSDLGCDVACVDVVVFDKVRRETIWLRWTETLSSEHDH
jgi:hypothetical protein